MAEHGAFGNNEHSIEVGKQCWEYLHYLSRSSLVNACKNALNRKKYIYDDVERMLDKKHEENLPSFRLNVR